MAPSPPAKPASGHVHTPDGRCEHCGAAVEVEHSYDVKDRYARVLLIGVCRSMGLEPFARSKKPLAPLYVRAPDRATLDRLWARFNELLHPLDDQLLEVTRVFLKEHCGLDMPLTPRA